MSAVMHTFVGFSLLFIVACDANGCKITSTWQELGTEERLLLSDIIVYGQTTQHVANIRRLNGRKVFSIDAIFHVYCVIKQNENRISEVITVEDIAPRDGCSGTKSFMQIGNEAIVALKASTAGKYQYHEVIPTVTATFAASRENFFKISTLCGLQLWVPPKNAVVNKCPVCGIANFSNSVMMADMASKSSTCLLSALVNNTRDCDYFTNASFDNSTMCLPTNFPDTCTNITDLVQPAVTCECSDNTSRNLLVTSQVDTAAVIVPNTGILTILVTLVTVFSLGSFTQQ